NQMKKSFTNWNKDGIDDAKLLADLREFSNGVINISPEDLHISEQRVQFNQRKPRANYNQRRKY
ncbi:DUF4290 domain-containing protein, partial [Phocaeicola paurosaccharolyticus]